MSIVRPTEKIKPSDKVPTAEQVIRWEALRWKLEAKQLNDVYMTLLEEGYKVVAERIKKGAEE